MSEFRRVLVLGWACGVFLFAVALTWAEHADVNGVPAGVLLGCVIFCAWTGGRIHGW